MDNSASIDAGSRQPRRAAPATVRGPAAAFGSHWDAAGGVLATHLSGVPTLEQVARWEEGLLGALAESGGAPVRILVDLAGYEVADVPWEVHREQREVLPRLLLALGHRLGYLELFRGAPRVAPGTRARVIAVAHVHHDREKMAHYEAVLGTRNDRYFSDRAAALGWLRDFPAGGIP